MLQRRPDVLARLVDTAADPASSELGEVPPSFRAELDASFDAWLDGLEKPAADLAETWASRLGEDAQTRGWNERRVLIWLERIGQAMLEAALDAVEEGVPGADVGARRVVGAMNTAAAAFNRAFRVKAEEAAKRAAVLRSVAENAPDGIGIAKPDGSVMYANPAFCTMMGSEEASRGHFADFVHPDEGPKLAQIAEVAEHVGHWDGHLRYKRADGTSFNARLKAFRVKSANGETIARCVLVRDATPEERSEEQRRALEEEIQRAQAEALRELAAPLLPLAEGVLAMPLVGSLDAARTPRIIELMLEGITRTGAGHVIVDITGVPVVDAEVAESIVRAARAAELVGAEVVLTGVRGAVAKTLVDLDVDLGGMDTWSTLRAGVAHAIGHERQKRRQMRRGAGPLR
ncbi:PAS domain S-box protein [Polyangium jinanense]|uniref:PAS domain S-box protein n=1 Tax=Polyangium jinanense TaxID=2829994 RepID=A0A9X3WYE9_9BACT|nr:PAS domain S-box protein [Polyangium jinanense]MDC3953634.1 PAS domain S-box protein [Polyangium jinanense]MDC3979245.1 PAS domain S-box protein [Polyangium jinanense]